MKDKEIERIQQKKLQDMINAQKEAKMQAQVSVLNMDASNFDDIIINSNLVLVDFWAEWCGPCKLMHPVFDRMAKKYRDIKFARVNVEQSQIIAQKYKVQSIPTFIMFRYGKIVERMIGAIGEPGIHMIAKKWLSITK